MCGWVPNKAALVSVCPVSWGSATVATLQSCGETVTELFSGVWGSCPGNLLQGREWCAFTAAEVVGMQEYMSGSQGASHGTLPGHPKACNGILGWPSHCEAKHGWPQEASPHSGAAVLHGDLALGRAGDAGGITSSSPSCCLQPLPPLPCSNIPSGSTAWLW